MNTTGLILDFLGAVVLLIYASKTVGATSQADQDYVASPWLPRIGWALIAGGFLLQLIGGIVQNNA
jgi:hypothetical protein